MRDYDGLRTSVMYFQNKHLQKHRGYVNNYVYIQ